MLLQIAIVEWKRQLAQFQSCDLGAALLGQNHGSTQQLFVERSGARAAGKREDSDRVWHREFFLLIPFLDRLTADPPVARAQARSKSKNSDPAAPPEISRTDSSLMAAPSPAENSAPFSRTAPRVTCSQAWRPRGSMWRTVSPSSSLAMKSLAS